MKTLALATAFGFSLLCGEAFAAAPTGTWLAASGNVEVHVSPCGRALCGVIVRVLANRSMSGSTADMGAVPGVGTKVLIDLKERKDGAWVGKLYNRENRKTYDCRVSLTSPNEMELRAYLGTPLLGQTQIWKRVR